MDIPVSLLNDSDLTFVSGYDEFKQSLFLLLRTWYGRFLQSADMGSRVSPHVSDVMLLRTGVSATVEQLHGCRCEEVVVSGDSILVRVSYSGHLADFEFSLSSLS